MERDAAPEDFVGKTITAVDTSSWNIWRFAFSDGTAIAIEAENHHGAGPGLLVCEECAEDFVETDTDLPTIEDVRGILKP